jgi:CRP/FNR family transcriptional regulator, cyclic AMP receptor protein
MADRSKLWYLENFNLLQGLKKEEMDYLNRITVMKEYPQEQPIYFAKEPSNSIFFLKKGRVKLTRTSKDGKEMILRIINAGEVFGEMAFLDEVERTDYAYAIDNALLCAINKNEFRQFVERIPELNLRLTKIIGFRLKRYTERIEELMFKDSKQRIISFLLNFAQDNGRQVAGEIFVKPFLKHQDIGELTACSRQTVSTILTELKDKSLIDFDRKKLIIRSPDELIKMT